MEEDSNIKNMKSYILRNSEIIEDTLDYQEFFLLKDSNIYKLIIGKNKKEVFIKCKNYMIVLNQIELSLLIKENVNSLNEAFDYIINIFEDNKVTIKTINKNEKIKLKIEVNKKNDFDLELIYNKNNAKYDPIKNEIKKLKDEINKLKKYNEINNPKDIKLSSNIIDDSFAASDLENTFTVFKAINDILYLIYLSKSLSIICYNLNDQKKIIELKKAHNTYITNFIHYLDEINKRDLIMSVSKNDNNIKIWNANNWECILNMTNANKVGWLLSSCFLKNNNSVYIVTSNCNKEGDSENMKIFDLNGDKIKEIYNSNERTYRIDHYYDNITNKNYIICGNFGYIKSYDYNNNQLYHKYYDNGKGSHHSIIIKNIKNVLTLVESSYEGNIRIWNFHSGLLLNKIKIGMALFGICLWNDNYLFVGCYDNSIKLIGLENNLIIKNLNAHDNRVLSMKKIIHPIYGECLISQNLDKSAIKLWINKNISLKNN